MKTEQSIIIEKTSCIAKNDIFIFSKDEAYKITLPKKFGKITAIGLGR